MHSKTYLPPRNVDVINVRLLNIPAETHGLITCSFLGASLAGLAPSEVPPVPRSKVEYSYNRPPPALLSPPMTPEDLQTIPIPEDLFRYEPPVAAVKELVPVSPVSNAPQTGRGKGARTQGRGRGAMREVPAHASGYEADESDHVGSIVPCRFFNKRGGCARGAQCAFSHVVQTPAARRTALEEELARKDLGERQKVLLTMWPDGDVEIERMRVELAAARAGAS